MSEIDRALELAARSPERFPIKHAGVRRVPVRRFPYSVFYRIASGRIVVIAVFHGRRDPMIWRART